MVAVVAGVLVVALVVAGGVALFGGSTNNVSPSSAGPVSPAAVALLRSALQAADHAGSVHYVSTSSASGKGGGTQKTVGDAGPNEGEQVITTGSQRFTVLVIGTACYVKGNAAALEDQLGLAPSIAVAHAQQWISLVQSDEPYAAVYAAVDFAQAISDNITIVPHQVTTAPAVHGRRVKAIVGTIEPEQIAGQTFAPNGTATLDVSAGASPLPVRYVQQGTFDGQQTRASITFSGWGESITVVAPAGPVPYATLASGSGGVSPTTGSTFFA